MKLEYQLADQFKRHNYKISKIGKFQQHNNNWVLSNWELEDISMSNPPVQIRALVTYVLGRNNVRMPYTVVYL